MAGTPSDDVDPVREVRRVHMAIEDAISGIRDDTSPVTNAFASEFTAVSPDGTLRDREAAIDELEVTIGAHADSSPPFVLDLQNVTHQFSVYDVHLVTYEAYRRIDGDWEGRTGSAWLRENDDAPTGLEWLHRHETWMIEKD